MRLLMPAGARAECDRLRAHATALARFAVARDPAAVDASPAGAGDLPACMLAGLAAELKSPQWWIVRAAIRFSQSKMTGAGCLGPLGTRLARLGHIAWRLS